MEWLSPLIDCFTEAKLRCNSGAQRSVGTTPTHPELGGEITEGKTGPARGTLWNLFPSARVNRIPMYNVMYDYQS